jgi:hypothetical protein
MTFVVELRDLKRGLPRPIIHFWRRAADALCALRVRLAFLGLLGCALDCPLDASVTAGSGVLALLCGVLAAAASATLGLICDASSALSGLLGEHASPAFRLDRGLGLRFAEPVIKFDICPETGPFPAFSWHCLVALVACALLLFGSGFSHRERAKQRGGC